MNELEYVVAMRKEIGICYHYEKRNCEDLEQRQRGR
jgi:hypothetical protein